MKRFVCLSVAVLWCAAVVSAAFASPEHVEEVWRSPYGYVLGPYQKEVNQRDGSLWLAEGATITHRSREGELLGRSQPLCDPGVLAPNPADGSCWVSEQRTGGLIHLASDGSVLSITPDLFTARDLYLVLWATVNPFDGSVWVVGGTMQAAQITPCSLIHVSAAGRTLSEEEGAWQVVVDPADGTTWTCSDDKTVRRNADGTEVWRVPCPGVAADADPRDQSLWVANSASGSSSTVTHLSASGAVLWQSEEPAGTDNYPYEVHVSHADGSVWIWYGLAPWLYSTELSAKSGPGWLHLDVAGVPMADSGLTPWFFNDLDGSMWAGPRDGTMGQIAQFSSSGELLSPSIPISWFSAYDQESNAFWTVYEQPPGVGDNELQRLAADGTVLWHEPMPALKLAQRTANPEDGSVWALSWRNDLVRFSPTGEELEQREAPVSLSAGWPRSDLLLTISPYDGTWWVSCGAVLTHVAADGTVLSQLEPVGAVSPVVNPVDGSVWVTWYQHTVYIESSGVGGKTYSVWQSLIHHVGADGTLLWTKEYTCHVAGLALDADGSAWVVADHPEGTKLEHLSAAGDLLGTPVPAPLAAAYGIARSPIDGSFYASGWGSDPEDDIDEGWIARVAADGSLLWKHGGFRNPANIALNPADGSVWVADLGDVSHPPSVDCAVAHFAADGTELWRGATFSRPWGLALDPRDGSVWVSDDRNEQLVYLHGTLSPFADVPGEFWAFDAIAACVAAGIVQGYGDGYHPDQPVTRDQMAVYVSRALAGGDEGVQVPSGTAEPTFSDVDEDCWAYRHIEYCVGASIAEGYPDGGYHPSAEVNRGQMAVYIARALVTPSGDAALPGPPHEPTFSDVTAENDWAWCYPHVEYCAAEGIVQGYWDGYHPERVVTRDQMAVYIARAFALPL